MHPRLALAAAALLATGALLALPAAGDAPTACPAPSVTGALQDDGGSGGDAGDARSGAVPLAHDGWWWGTLDAPLEYGMEDAHDWFAVQVPEGPRDVTIQVIAGTDQVAPPDTVVIIYYLAMWRAGDDEVAVADTISYLPEFTFPTPGPGAYHLHVTSQSLLWGEVCAASGASLDGPGVVPQLLQGYGVRFACAPACMP